MFHVFLYDDFFIPLAVLPTFSLSSVQEYIFYLKPTNSIISTLEASPLNFSYLFYQNMESFLDNRYYQICLYHSKSLYIHLRFRFHVRLSVSVKSNLALSLNILFNIIIVETIHYCLNTTLQLDGNSAIVNYLISVLSHVFKGQ